MFRITNPGAPAFAARTATAETLPAAFDAAASLALTLECDVLIEDCDPETAGPVARIVWADN